MGILFVVFIHLIILFILSTLIAIINAFIVYFISKKEKIKRKIFLALFSPFSILFSSYILALIGLSIVSEIKKVDIGIGDSWYVPLNSECEVLMIDLPEQAYIMRGSETIISDVSQIQQCGEIVYGKTFQNNYFIVNLKTMVIKINLPLKDLAQKVNGLNLIDVPKFYEERKWELTGSWDIFIGILALFISTTITFIFCRFVLFGWKLGLNKTIL